MKKLLLTLIALVAIATGAQAQWYSSRNMNIGGTVCIPDSRGYVTNSYHLNFIKSTCQTVTFPQGGSTDKITAPVVLMGKDPINPIKTYGNVTVWVDVPNSKIVLENNSSVSVGIKYGFKLGGKDEYTWIRAQAGQTVSQKTQTNTTGGNIRFYYLRLRECNGLSR